MENWNKGTTVVEVWGRCWHCEEAFGPASGQQRWVIGTETTPEQAAHLRREAVAQATADAMARLVPEMAEHADCRGGLEFEVDPQEREGWR